MRVVGRMMWLVCPAARAVLGKRITSMHQTLRCAQGERETNPPRCASPCRPSVPTRAQGERGRGTNHPAASVHVGRNACVSDSCHYRRQYLPLRARCSWWNASRWLICYGQSEGRRRSQNKLTRRCALQLGHVNLGHLHHRLHCATRFRRVLVTEQAHQRLRHNLP